ncbi:MAG: tRNA 2-selenouridine(34) synthase MnmH [Ginsengibacter sp.]
MAIQKIPIEQFLSLAQEHPVLDVRSPSEFIHAHIPSAYSLPLFNDEERKIVGTTYKQQSRQQAIKTGLDYFGIKMRKMVEEVESLMAGRWSLAEKKAQAINDQRSTNIVLIHCWRGGMRSTALAWLLDLYGHKVYTLAGGYKAFRNWVLQQFNTEYNLKILGGYTGSGKTILIEAMRRLGKPVINLEALANHKGSAFGALGEKPQPSQEMFENILALELYSKASHAAEGLEEPLWMEDESKRIGELNIPKSLWDQMRSSPVYFIDIPFEQRLSYLVKTYGTLKKDELLNAIGRIQKRLGGLETKNAVKYLSENDIRESFSILLKYYDKCYSKGLHNRINLDDLLNKISCETVTINNVEDLYPLKNKV